METNAELIVEGHGTSLHHALAALRHEGISRYAVYADLANTTRTVDGVTIQGVNAWLRAGVNDFLSRSPPDGWLIWADVDEFYTWPCDIIPQLMRARNRDGSRVMAVCGRMQDRVTADFSLPEVAPDESVSSQFPKCAQIRNHITRALAVKLTLLSTRVQGAVPHFRTAHTASVQIPISGSSNSSAHPPKSREHVMGGFQRTHCLQTSSMLFAHYTTTRQAGELALAKQVDFALRDGRVDVARTYSRFERMIARNESTNLTEFTPAARKLVAAVMEPCQPEVVCNCSDKL